MQFTVKASHLLALAIIGGIGWWMYGGDVKVGGQAGNEQAATAEAQVEEPTPQAEETELFKVSVVTIEPVERQRTVDIRGRTKAEAIIPIRAETGGVLEKRMFDRGDRVNEGDLVCVIAQGTRKADVASAEARYEQMRGEYESNTKLKEKGFVTDTVMRQKLFDLNAAMAQLEQAKLELARTEVKANASGIVQDPIAEVGDVLPTGGNCLTLIDADPMFFTGQISERLVNQVKNGMAAEIALVTGETTMGEVTYIAPSADAATRTFPVEIRLDGTASGTIRDGITASASILLPKEMAIRISPSWLTLAESGEIGVKVLDSANKVQFKSVEILSQTNNGFWVAGINNGDRVITMGQEYVIDGETVDPVPMEFEQAEVRQ